VEIPIWVRTYKAGGGKLRTFKSKAWTDHKKKIANPGNFGSVRTARAFLKRPTR